MLWIDINIILAKLCKIIQTLFNQLLVVKCLYMCYVNLFAFVLISVMIGITIWKAASDYNHYNLFSWVSNKLKYFIFPPNINPNLPCKKKKFYRHFNAHFKSFVMLIAREKGKPDTKKKTQSDELAM